MTSLGKLKREIKVFISSPSDATEEIKTAENCFLEWNANNPDADVILTPISFKRNTHSEMGKHPQEIINQQALFQADYLIAIFKHRFGTPTLKFNSGTEEEIELFCENPEKGADRVSVYFSSERPNDETDPQYKKVQDFKKTMESKGLYQPFSSNLDLFLLINRRISQKITRIKTEEIIGAESAPIPSELLFEDQIKKSSGKADELNPYSSLKFGYMEIIIFPSNFKKSRFNISELKERAKQSVINTNGFPFLFITDSRPDLTYVVEDGLETVITEKFSTMQRFFYFWDLKQSGFFYIKKMLYEDSYKRDSTKILNFRDLIFTVAESILCMANLFNGAFDISEIITYKINLKDMNARTITSSSFGIDQAFVSSYTSRIENISVEKKQTLKYFSDNLIKVSIEISKEILERFNWSNPNLIEFEKLIPEQLKKRM